MAQGAVKKAPKSTAPKKSTGPGRGTRIIKPKKAALLNQRKLTHKHTSQLTVKTEKLLAQKAGHLELLKGGKRDNKKDGKDNKK